MEPGVVIGIMIGSVVDWWRNIEEITVTVEAQSKKNGENEE